MKTKSYRLSLAVIIILALALRIYMIRANLPYVFWHDENNYIEMALKLASGDFRFMSLSHGGLYQIILCLGYICYYIFAMIAGAFSSPADFYISFLKDPTLFFLFARSVSVIAGAGVILLSYCVASKMYSKRTAMAASLFTGFSFLMLQTSFLALADTMSVFILLGGFLALIYSVERPLDKRFYCIASVLFGLATACKYLSVFGIIPLLIAAIIKSQGRPHRFLVVCYYLLFGATFAGLGFCIGMPFFMVNVVKFYNDTFVRMGGEYILRNPHKNTWLFHFTNHLRNGLGVPLEVTSLAGVAYALYRRTKWDIIMLAFPTAFYFFIMHSMGFAYHLLPAIPFILILAARLLDDIAERLFPSRALIVCMTMAVVVLAPSLSDSLKFARIFTSPDTRILAKEWIERDILQDSVILAEGYVFTRAVHGPPIAGNKETLRRDLGYIVARGGTGFPVKMELENLDKIYGQRRLFNIFKTDIIHNEDIERHVPEYIILTGANDTDVGKELLYYLPDDYFEKRRKLRASVIDNYVIARSFEPTHEFSATFPLLMDNDYRIIRQSSLSDLKDYRKGPRIDVFVSKRSGE